MGAKLGCQAHEGATKADAATHRSNSSLRENRLNNSAGDVGTLDKVGQLRSGNTSQSDGVMTHSSTLPYRPGGSEYGSTVANPLDPVHGHPYPVEDRSTDKPPLAMRDVPVLPVTAAQRTLAGVPPPLPSSTSPTHRAHVPQLARLGLRPTAAELNGAPEAQRTLAGGAQNLSSHDNAESGTAASHSRLDMSGPFMGNSRRESSLTDITMDDDSTSPMHASISGHFRHSAGGLGFPYRGEDLELQRQQAPLNIEEDLFIYDDIVISKDEARTKHWRLAGRKPALQLDAINLSGKDGAGSSGGGGSGSGSRGGSPSAAAAAARRLSTSGHQKFFSFNDFDVCVDEMDFSLTRASATQAAAVEPPSLDAGAPTSPVMANQASVEEDMGTMTSFGSGACGASFYTKLSDRVSVMSTVPTAHNTGPALDARGYEMRAKTGRVLKDFTYDTIIGHATRVKCIALCPSEKDYASCSNEDASVTLCNLGVRDEVGIFTGHVDTVINTTFSPDGKYLATTSKDKTMILWDVMTTKKILTFSHAKVVICCCFAPDSKYLVSGCQDRVCRLWDTRRGKEWLSYTQHDGIIIAIAFSPDGNYVCSASADKTLRVWSTSTAKTRFTLSGHTGIILACSYSNDGKHIISNDEASLRVWNTEDGSCKLSLNPSQIAGSTHLTAKGPKLGWTLSCAAPGAFTNYLLVACNNRFVYVIDLNSGEEVHSVFCKAPVYCLAAGTKDLTACGDSFGNIYVLRLQ